MPLSPVPHAPPHRLRAPCNRCSATVFINGKQAGRIGDPIDRGGTAAAGPPNGLIGPIRRAIVLGPMGIFGQSALGYGEGDPEDVRNDYQLLHAFTVVDTSHVAPTDLAQLQRLGEFGHALRFGDAPLTATAAAQAGPCRSAGHAGHALAEPTIWIGSQGAHHCCRMTLNQPTGKQHQPFSSSDRG
jgi:hypothetical protein